MKKLGLLLMVIIAGCADNENCGIKEGTNNNIAMYGDSLCRACGSSPDLARISKQCDSGSTLVLLDGFKDHHELIFLAKGTNDILLGVAASYYERELNRLLNSTDSEIVCILPNHHPYLPSDDIRQAMIDNCESYIDPVSDCGVSIGDSDGIHYTEADHTALASCLTPIVDEINDYTTSHQ